MTDDDIRRLVNEEAARVADERIKSALTDRHNLSPRDIDVRLKGTRHENSDHLDRALNVLKLKPSTASGDVATTVGGDVVWSAPVSGGASVGSATPLMDGTATAGVSAAASRQDHVHPTDTSRLAVTTAASTYQPLDSDLTTIAALDSGTAAGVMTTDAAGWLKKSYASFKTLLVLVKGDVGLGNVDNTSDVNKPISTATQNALDAETTARVNGDVAVQQDVDDLAEDFGVHHHDDRYYTRVANDTLLSAYLTTASASSTYAALAGAAFTGPVTVPNVAIGAGTNAATIGAVNTVLGSYLTSATAASTYAPLTSPTFVTSAFAPTVAIGAGTNIATIGAVNTALGSYLTTASATATYLTIANAASTYATAANLTAHTGSSTAHTAASIVNTPSGTTSSTTVQAAIDEIAGDVLLLSSGSGIPANTVDVKGDIIVATADNVVARRAAPSDRYSLAADSSQTDGWRNEVFATRQSVDDFAEDFGVHHHDDRYVSQSLLSARGDVITRGASAPQRLALGAAGSHIVSDGTDAVWKTPAQRYKVGAFAIPGATGSKAVTGLGFKPGLVMFTNSWININEIMAGTGSMDGSGGQWCQFLHENSGGAKYSGSSTTDCLALVNAAAGNATLYAAQYVSMDTDGFTINFSAITAGSGNIRWIAYA